MCERPPLTLQCILRIINDQSQRLFFLKYNVLRCVFISFLTDILVQEITGNRICVSLCRYLNVNLFYSISVLVLRVRIKPFLLTFNIYIINVSILKIINILKKQGFINQVITVEMILFTDKSLTIYLHLNLIESIQCVFLLLWGLFRNIMNV